MMSNYLPSSFHDGVFQGVTILGNDVEFLLSTASGKCFRLTLRKVDTLTVSNFREGNIILDVTVDVLDSGKLELSVNPSYGAEAVAVCDQVDYREVDPDA